MVTLWRDLGAGIVILIMGAVLIGVVVVLLKTAGRLLDKGAHWIDSRSENTQTACGLVVLALVFFWLIWFVVSIGGLYFALGGK